MGLGSKDQKPDPRLEVTQAFGDLWAGCHLGDCASCRYWLIAVGQDADVNTRERPRSCWWPGANSSNVCLMQSLLLKCMASFEMGVGGERPERWSTLGGQRWCVESPFIERTARPSHELPGVLE